MKQKTLFLSFGAVFLSLTLLLSFLFHVIEDSFLDQMTANTQPVETPVIILDAGHGGEDGGQAAQTAFWKKT